MLAPCQCVVRFADLISSQSPAHVRWIWQHSDLKGNILCLTLHLKPSRPLTQEMNMKQKDRNRPYHNLVGHNFFSFTQTRIQLYHEYSKGRWDPCLVRVFHIFRRFYLSQSDLLLAKRLNFKLMLLLQIMVQTMKLEWRVVDQIENVMCNISNFVYWIKIFATCCV